MPKMKPFILGYCPFPDWESFYNGKYQVQLKHAFDAKRRPLVILSIRREDRKAIMDWRDMQWIKNQLLGPEWGAVQLFPAESRLVDTANQYYLYAYPPEVYQHPFGFTERAVSAKSMRTPFGKTEQREFGEHVRPPDLEDQDALPRSAYTTSKETAKV